MKLDAELCTEDNFPYRNWTEALQLGIDEYYCLSSTGPNLTKFSTVSQFSDLIVYTSLCQNTTECNNSTSMSEAVYGSIMRAIIIDSYFDPNSDDDDMIHTYLNNNYRIILSLTFWSEMAIGLTPNVLEIENGATLEFYNSKTKYQTSGYFDSFYLGVMRFPIDSLANYYERYEFYQPQVIPESRRNMNRAMESMSKLYPLFPPPP